MDVKLFIKGLNFNLRIHSIHWFFITLILSAIVNELDSLFIRFECLRFFSTSFSFETLWYFF